jgi:DNA (cytosine-5)-methyltransferase 1
MILSIFPGIDLLGRAFEEAGYCVVRGPDLIYGGDIRLFSVEPDIFEGVIGGPPCQDFSLLRRTPPTGYGLEMLKEYRRVVLEAKPRWWLMENVATVPDMKIGGYTWQRLDINQSWYEGISRLRHVQYGSDDGRYIDVTRQASHSIGSGAALASDTRGVTELAKIQGVPSIELPGFTVAGKKRAIGNAVPMSMGRVLAEAVKSASVTAQRQLCGCGCGRRVTGKQLYISVACRKRAQRRRDSSRVENCDGPREIFSV